MRLSLKNNLFVLVSIFGNLHGANAEGKVLMAPEKDAIQDSFIILLKEDVPGEDPPGEGKRRRRTTAQNHVSGFVEKLTDENPNIVVTSTYSAGISGFSANMTIDDAEELAKNPEVNYIEQDRLMYLPDDDIVRVNDVGSWGLDRIDQRDNDLDDIYEPFGRGEGVTAYIVDTGILITHNDFGGRAIFGTNTVDGLDDDCNGHGTHVAGTVGGTTYGVANKVELVAVKVLGCSGGGTTSGIIDAIDWMIDDADQKQKPATANFSLGGGSSSSLNDAVKELHESGVVTVVAAGNSNANACNYSPAGERSVITVGSTTRDDERSSFSNYGTCLDIFAPGSSITAPWIGNDNAINTISGTSMASPHVCGVVALYLGELYPADSIPGILVERATSDVLSGVGSGSPNELLFVEEGSPTTPSPTRNPSPTPAPSDCAGSLVVVTINTDFFSTETTWTLENDCDDPTFETISGGPYAEGDTEYITTECVPSGRYTFTIYDVFGDGICCSFGDGSYLVEYNGRDVASGAEFGESEETTFGRCRGGPGSPTRSPRTDSPTRAPITDSPTRAPITDSPTRTPRTDSPTPPQPTRSPTSRAPTTNDPLPLSWNIDMESSAIVPGEQNPQIQVLYETSNRPYSVEVFQEDCKSSVTDGLLPVTTSHSDSDEKGFIDLQVNLDVDQSAIEDDDTIWTPDAGVGGSFKFCLSTSLYKGDSNDENLVTRKDVLFEVSVANVASFDVGGITIEVEEVETVDLSIEYQGEIDVYQCNEEGDEEPKPLGPFDLLHVCVKVKDDESIRVTDILDFTVKQGSIGFPAIQDGIIDDLDADVVIKECKSDYCIVSMQPLAAFFIEPEELEVFGMVSLGSASRSRSVQQKEFDLKVVLVQEPCKEGKGMMKILRSMSW